MASSTTTITILMRGRWRLDNTHVVVIITGIVTEIRVVVVSLLLVSLSDVHPAIVKIILLFQTSTTTLHHSLTLVALS